MFQIANLEQQVLESSEKLKSAEHQIIEKQQHMDKLVSTTVVQAQHTQLGRAKIYQPGTVGRLSL